MTSPTTNFVGFDTRALIDLLAAMRACNRNLDSILNEFPVPAASMAPMSADYDGVSRGLVASDDMGTYAIYLQCPGVGPWTLRAASTRRGGEETTYVGQVPFKLRATFGASLGHMTEGMA